MRFLAAFILSTCLAAGSARAADPVAPPVIGAIYSATGAGGVARAALATALEIVNGTHDPVPVLMGQGGGLDRWSGAKLAVAFADDADDPATVARAAEHLIADEGAVMLTGGLSEASAAAISRVAEAHGLPFVALDGTLANDSAMTWFFRLGRTPRLDARFVLQQLGATAAANGKPLGSVAMLFDDTPAGQALATAWSSAAEAAKLRMVAIPVPPGAALSGPALHSVIAAAPDIILSWRGSAAELEAIAPVVILSPPDASGDEGVFRSASFTLAPLPARPGVSIVDAAFKARTGRSLDVLAARQITGLLLLADVINRAGSSTPIDLRTALMATDTPGRETLMLWQGIRFDDGGQNVRASPGLQQMQQGAWQTVAPEEIAVGAPTWPAAK